jgi:hypothetical protein
VGLWLSLQNAKPYYLVAAYPMVLAAGAVAVSEWLARWRSLARLTDVALPLLAAAAGLVVAPMTIPLLEAEAYVAYEQALGLRPRDMEVNATAELPQHFADRFGWRELTVTVAGVVTALPADERARCLIVTGNYGECGALIYWGDEHELPPVVSGHNSCHSWWPEALEPEVVVVVGASRERLATLFADVALAATNQADWAMPYESTVPVWVCRNPLQTWDELRAAARTAG